MKKLFLPLLVLLMICACASAYAATVPGQQSIAYVSDGSGEVTDLTDDDASTAWIAPGTSSPDLTLHFNYASVGEIWVRNGYAYTQNWYNHYDRPGSVKVTVYYQANQVTTTYDTYRYQLTDACRPNSVSRDWSSGYQRLLLPKQYRNVSKIEITIESVITGTGRTGAAISDILVASGSHATATPKSYATATPRPYVVYITPTPGPWTEEDDEDDSLVDYITPKPNKTSKPTATPLVEKITPKPSATPEPLNFPSLEGVVGYTNQWLSTRSGPGNQYDEPGTVEKRGTQVKVISKVWDEVNELYWFHFECRMDGEWRRIYSTDYCFDVDPDLVFNEQPHPNDPLDTRYAIGTHPVHYGPGLEYGKAKDAIMVPDKKLDVYAIENGWVLVDYYDYNWDVRRRGWVPLNVVYPE